MVGNHHTLALKSRVVMTWWVFFFLSPIHTKIFFVSSLLQYRMHPSGPLRMEFGSGVGIHPEVQCHHISPIIGKNLSWKIIVSNAHHNVLWWWPNITLIEVIFSIGVKQRSWHDLTCYLGMYDVFLPLQSNGESLWSKWYSDASSQRWEDMPPLGESGSTL